MAPTTARMKGRIRLTKKTLISGLDTLSPNSHLSPIMMHIQIASIFWRIREVLSVEGWTTAAIGMTGGHISETIWVSNSCKFIILLLQKFKELIRVLVG